MLKSIAALAVVLGCCLLAQSAAAEFEETCQVLTDDSKLEQKTESEVVALANGCVEALVAADSTWNTVLGENNAEKYATSLLALFNSDATPSDVNEHSKSDFDKARHLTWSPQYAEMIIPNMPQGYKEFCKDYKPSAKVYNRYLLLSSYALDDDDLINNTLAKNANFNKVIVLFNACGAAQILDGWRVHKE